jgi:2-polyprenyl-3-methyl-5-hydroxy-6-metoxy-1,4-benzoquinol methylase
MLKSKSSRCPLCSGDQARVIFTKQGFTIVKCSTCNLVYVANPPTDSEIRDMYSFSSGYHIELAQEGAVARAKFSAAAQRYIRLIEKHRQGGRILDVGCSFGAFLEVAREGGWETYGVEISDDTASLARARGLNVVTGTLADGPLPTSSVDVVTLWDVLEHVRDPVGSLRLANAILGPGGIIGLSTPNVDGVFPRLSLLSARVAGVWPHPEPPFHLVQFSKKTIKRSLQRAGFEILEIVERRIPLGYTFGTLTHVLRSPKRAAYAAMFAPIALIGPVIGAGDQVDVIARKIGRPDG